MSIVTEHLSKQFGSQKAVNDISFKVSKGEIVGFLGPNGAGKSTTMKMITGYLDYENGNVHVCGEKVNVDSIYTKSKIGYLPEQNPLYYDMFVREYLYFVAGVHQLKAAKDKVQQVIQQVGLTIEANKKIGQLSKGYKQRVGLAAAIIHDPEVLILDEPTTGLDPNQILEIRELIKTLGADKTVLFSSHILQEVEAICDRVVIINKGSIVADESLSVLKSFQLEKQQIRVEFKEDISEEMLCAQIQGGIKKISAGVFVIDTNQLESTKKAIMAFSLEKNINIISLQSDRKNSLEDIFKSLTGNN